MATIVNNPAPTSDNSQGGMGFFLGVILLLIFAFLFFYYGLPLITNSVRSASSGPSVNIPGKIDVNVHTNK